MRDPCRPTGLREVLAWETGRDEIDLREAAETSHVLDQRYPRKASG